MIKQFTKTNTQHKEELPRIPEEFRLRKPTEELLGLMSYDVMSELRSFVFSKEEDVVCVATTNPKLPALHHFIPSKFGAGVRMYLATSEEVDFVLGCTMRDYRAEIAVLLSDSSRSGDVMVHVIELLLRYASAQGASDIHIEPTREDTMVRLRVDGRLHQVFTIPSQLHTSAVARLKVLANLKIDESRLPQDGRIEPEDMGGISFRISTVPTLYGEKMVLRLLTDSNKNLEMNTLGFSPEQQEIILRNIDKPYGMIVASGPTGSGKTTTLYAMVSKLASGEMNISTLEDPIEYALSGVNQIQVNARIGLTFASGLRSLLRQDPDIIMIGEIRDAETMNMATNAALTGHLVLATIHTNDAPSALTRFMDMKVEDFVVASIVNLIIAQRLVRRVCDDCRTKKKLDEHLIKKITERPDLMEVLNARGLSIDALKKSDVVYGAGCTSCFMTGYRGRVGIYELFETTPEINALVLQHASRDEIRKEAERGGFKSMVNDGVEKVFKGETTFEEVLRSTKNN
jgi:type II secretory ATPase GspE/PulE/Tfp pilus assembly ATPase PilB-like protein